MHNEISAIILAIISVLVISELFPDDEDRDGPWNVGLRTIQQHGVAASPKIFYWKN